MLILPYRQQDIVCQKNTESHLKESFQNQASRTAAQSQMIQKSVLKASQTSSDEHKKTLSLIDCNTTKVIDALCSKIDDLPGKIQQAHARARMNNRVIRFVGESPETMLATLLLLAPIIRQAILRIYSQQSEPKQASIEHLSWLQSELQNLVSSATQEVAAMSHGSTATPFDKWIYSLGTTSFSSREENGRSASTGWKRSRSDCGPITLNSKSEKERRERLKTKAQSHEFTSPTGRIHIKIPSSNDDSTPNLRNLTDIGFSFFPSYNTGAMLIEAHFTRCLYPVPQLYTQLNTFRLVDEGHEVSHRRIIIDGSLERIDAAFRNGTISPYD